MQQQTPRTPSTQASGPSEESPPPTEGERGNSFQQEQLQKEPRTDIGPRYPIALEGGSAIAPPTTREQALNRFAENVSFFREFIAESSRTTGDSSERATLLRNSVEWITSGRVVVELRSPVDAATNQRRPDGTPPSQQGYVVWAGRWPPPAAATYDPSGSDVHWREPASGFASNDGSRLTLVDPLQATEANQQLANTLIHETQHITEPLGDVSLPTGGASPPATAPPWAYRLLRSEINGWGVESPDTPALVAQAPAQPSVPLDITHPVTGAAVHTPVAVANEFQRHVLTELLPPGTVWTGGRFAGAYTWFSWWVTVDEAFRTYAMDTQRPTSSNLVNSVRVDGLQRAVRGHDVERTLTAAAALDATDRAALTAPGTMLDLSWASADDQARIRAAIGAPSATRTPTRVLVGDGGDTPADLAGRYLGSNRRWQLLLDANPGARFREHEAPSGESHLLMGQTLVIPDLPAP